MLVVKFVVTALIVVAVSEIVKRTDRLGALLASLPLTTLLVLFWMYVEKQPTAKLASYAYYTFWFVVPTLPMFLQLPWMLERGYGFWLSLGAAVVVTFVSYILTALVARHFGANLWP